MSYFVYIIRSTKNHHYIGYTTNLYYRIYQHNNKHHGSTYRLTEEWTLLISCEYSTKQQAMETEKKLKSFKNFQRAIRYLEKQKEEVVLQG